MGQRTSPGSRIDEEGDVVKSVEDTVGGQEQLDH
jgi:hypothetical protein